MINTITRTDKCLFYTNTTLITFIILIGNMNISDPTIQAAFISVVGALVSAFSASRWTSKIANSTQRKRDEILMHNTKIYFLDILLKIYLPGISQMIEDSYYLQKKLLLRQIEFFKYNDSNFLQSNFYDLFDKNTLIKTLQNEKINISDLASLIIIINSCRLQIPENIISNFLKIAEKLSIELQEEINRISESTTLTEEEKIEKEDSARGAYETIYNSYRIRTIETLKHSCEQFHQLEYKIKNITENLN